MCFVSEGFACLKVMNMFYVFSLRSLLVVPFRFRFMIYLNFFFFLVNGVNWGGGSFFTLYGYPTDLAICKAIIFPQKQQLHLCHKSSDCKWMNLFLVSLFCTIDLFVFTGTIPWNLKYVSFMKILLASGGSTPTFLVLAISGSLHLYIHFRFSLPIFRKMH